MRFSRASEMTTPSATGSAPPGEPRAGAARDERHAVRVAEARRPPARASADARQDDELGHRAVAGERVALVGAELLGLGDHRVGREQRGRRRRGTRRGEAWPEPRWPARARLSRRSHVPSACARARSPCWPLPSATFASSISVLPRAGPPRGDAVAARAARRCSRLRRCEAPRRRTGLSSLRGDAERPDRGRAARERVARAGRAAPSSCASPALEQVHGLRVREHQRDLVERLDHVRAPARHAGLPARLRLPRGGLAPPTAPRAAACGRPECTGEGGQSERRGVGQASGTCEASDGVACNVPGFGAGESRFASRLARPGGGGSRSCLRA